MTLTFPWTAWEGGISSWFDLDLTFLKDDFITFLEGEFHHLVGRSIEGQLHNI